MIRLGRMTLLLFVGILVSCQTSVPLDKPFTIEDDANPVRVAGTELEIASCYRGEDFSEDGGDLWFGMRGTLAGEEVEIERYENTFSLGPYEIQVMGADLFGGCTLIVRTLPD